MNPIARCLQKARRFELARTPNAGRIGARVRQLGLQLVRLADNTGTSDFLLYIDGADADFRPTF